MTQIIVQPDAEIGDACWMAIGFEIDSDATAEAVSSFAFQALKENLPILERLEHWIVNYSRVSWIKGDPCGPRLHRAQVQGDRSRMIENQQAQLKGLPTRPQISPALRGKTDWVIEVQVRRPKFQTPKYMDPLGPSAGFERTEDAPADLKEMLGVTGSNN